jgi:DNA-binding XRE family transcriptional regulator/predicted RNase H-like HicB family nuclease
MRYPAKVVELRGGKRGILFPDLPGCDAEAGSESEVQEDARRALNDWLERLLGRGERPPPVGESPTLCSWIWVPVEPCLAVPIQIRGLRTRLGWTQAELGRRLGVTQQQVAKLERPGGNPMLGTLVEAARAMNAELTVEFLARWP